MPYLLLSFLCHWCHWRHLPYWCPCLYHLCLSIIFMSMMGSLRHGQHWDLRGMVHLAQWLSQKSLILWPSDSDTRSDHRCQQGLQWAQLLWKAKFPFPYHLMAMASIEEWQTEPCMMDISVLWRFFILYTIDYNFDSFMSFPKKAIPASWWSWWAQHACPKKDAQTVTKVQWVAL